MRPITSFLAGFVSTLVAHQGLLGLMFLAGLAPAAPYNMAPTSPLGVPQVLSLAFWGGIWGIALWQALRPTSGITFWAVAAAFGAIGPTLVAMLIVLPMKGIAPTAAMWIGGVILNGAWGLGTAALIRLYDSKLVARA